MWICTLIAGMVGCGQPEPEYTPAVAAGWDHTVGVKPDGTVVAVGRNHYGHCNVGRWTGIVSRSPQAAGTRWGLRPTAPWSPWDTTTTGSAMSAAGRTSPRSLQAGITRWGLSPTALWSPPAPRPSLPDGICSRQRRSMSSSSPAPSEVR